MGTSIKQWLRNFWSRVSERVHRPQKGQSLVIVILALIAILAFVGMGVDLGLVYVERVRVGRAADAAALAAVAELPAETAAHERAKVYLMENGYNPDAVSSVRLVVDGNYVSGPAEDAAETILWIDTAFSRSAEGAANRVRVRIRQWVPMTFLQFIGFRRIPVEGAAEAENINNLDVVIVYDESGSMEYDTLCYGCWDPWGTNAPGTANDCNDPDGCLYPLKWSKGGPTATPNHCETGHTIDPNYHDGTSGWYFTRTDEYYQRNSGDHDYYIIIEAEEYSYYDERADYHQWQYSPYRTFWVMQRNAYNWDSGRDVGAKGRDSRGAYVSHHPWPNEDNTSGYGVSCQWSDVTSAGYDGNGPYCDSSDTQVMEFGGPFPVPRVDYVFTVPDSGTYYFWIRAQGGQSNADDDIFWGVAKNTLTPLTYPTDQESNFYNGANYDGARNDRWDWERLTRGSQDGVSLTAGQTNVLSFWGGGAGFDIDRIIITNDDTDWEENRRSSDTGDNDDDNTTSDHDDLPLQDSPPNNARTGWACERCDPRFAGMPGGLHVDMDPGPGEDWWWLPDCNVGAHPDQREDPIYKGELPIRDALKSAINFVDRMDFTLDQVGYVSYDTNSGIRNELECLRLRGPADLSNPDCDPYWSDPGHEPPTDEDCGCFDEDFNSTIDNTVVYELNSTFSGGSTNMAGGMKDGIDVLSNDETPPGVPHYGRPGAAHIMVLMTDGVANQTPNWYCDDDPDRQWPGGDAAQDCVIYYAYEARKNTIVIYTISLGYSADLEIMQEVATITGGEHRWAPSPDKLDDIFDELFERIFVRLTD
jgi:hypothetical protein